MKKIIDNLKKELFLWQLAAIPDENPFTCKFIKPGVVVRPINVDPVFANLGVAPHKPPVAKF